MAHRPPQRIKTTTPPPDVCSHPRCWWRRKHKLVLERFKAFRRSYIELAAKYQAAIRDLREERASRREHDHDRAREPDVLELLGEDHR